MNPHHICSERRINAICMAANAVSMVERKLWNNSKVRSTKLEEFQLGRWSYCSTNLNECPTADKAGAVGGGFAASEGLRATSRGPVIWPSVLHRVETSEPSR